MDEWRWQEVKEMEGGPVLVAVLTNLLIPF